MKINVTNANKSLDEFMSSSQKRNINQNRQWIRRHVFMRNMGLTTVYIDFFQDATTDSYPIKAGEKFEFNCNDVTIVNLVGDSPTNSSFVVVVK